MEKSAVERFLSSGSGDGSGYSYGSGFGFGYGDCDGYGYGSGSGSGYGDGCGYGDGDGSGSGYGYGYGYGSGFGSGDGFGYGDGYGDGIISFNGDDVYVVDGIPTIIKSIRGNIAKGFILNDDLTLSKCFVAKIGSYFAHGDSIESAIRDARVKQLEDAEPEGRVDAFLEQYPNTSKYTGHELFAGHHLLTGSCEMGRSSFVANKGINLDAEYSLIEFCSLVRDAYATEIIDLLISKIEDTEERYGRKG